MKVDKLSAFLKIASYFTVIIPLICGIVYACSNTLQGRVTYPSLRSSNTAAECRVFANTISAQSAPLLTYQQLHEKLEAWVASEGERATEAAGRIEGAYQNDLTTLDLSSLGLKTLPSVIGQLIQLIELNLSKNQLTTLCAEIAQLSLLRTLVLSENQLSTFPAEISQLRRLEVLILSENQLRTLPAEIGQLRQLQLLYLNSNQLTTLPAEIGHLLELLLFLYLHDNQLTTLPAEIGHLLQLKRLELRGNPTLSEIPIALGNLLHITELDISGTSIPPTQRDLVLAAIRIQRDAGAVEQLPLKLNLWKGYAQMPGLNLDISVLEDPAQKKLIHEWLVRLERVRDFQRSQRSLCETACRILNTVLEDGTFRETFFVQVRDNLEGCGDRAAMSLNEIYTAWVLATLPPEATTQRKLEILKGVAKTNTLHRSLQQLIDNHERATCVQERESVEIYLYYECTLRAELSLVSATQDMLYAPMGQRAWIDVSRLIGQVRESYLDTLIEIPAFDALIKQDQLFMRQWAPVEAQFQEQLASLSEGLTSETYLTRTKEIQAARKLAWKTAAIRWAQSS